MSISNAMEEACREIKKNWRKVIETDSQVYGYEHESIVRIFESMVQMK